MLIVSRGIYIVPFAVAEPLMETISTPKIDMIIVDTVFVERVNCYAARPCPIYSAATVTSGFVLYSKIISLKEGLHPWKESRSDLDQARIKMFLKRG